MLKMHLSERSPEKIDSLHPVGMVCINSVSENFYVVTNNVLCISIKISYLYIYEFAKSQ